MLVNDQRELENILGTTEEFVLWCKNMNIQWVAALQW
jgi:hypothetical protein